MKDFLKSYKTTMIGLIAIIGLIVHAFSNGGINVQDFLLLTVGIGFIASKDADKTHSSAQSIGGELPKDDDEGK